MPEFTIDDLVDCTLDSGKAAMDVYNREHAVSHKADQSPVTEADLLVDRIVVEELSARYPQIPVVTEERSASHDLAACGDRFFLVDPIDGTKEFIRQTGEFTINIALIENGQPVAGIVYAPAIGRLFLGQSGSGAREIQPDGKVTHIAVRPKRTDTVAVASRSHLTEETKNFLDANKIENCVNAGSSLKFCLVAAGEADIYPRFGPTMEWDTAAGHAVLAAAGGRVLTCDGTPLNYGKTAFRNPFFIASSPTTSYTLPE